MATTMDTDNNSPLSWLLYPLRGAALGVLVAFALLMSLARAAGFFGLWLQLILIIALSAYAFMLLDGVAAGRRQPPEMSSAVLSPWHERRPLWLLLATGIGLGIHSGLSQLAPPLARLIGYLLLAALPAAIAILGLESAAPARVLNPLSLARAIWGMGRFYIICLLALAAAAVLFRAAETAPLLRPLSMFLQLYALLVIFGVIGGTLYRRRHRLGTVTLDSPEQRTARRLDEQQTALDQALDEAYRLARVGRLDAAYEEIQTWFSTAGRSPGDRIRLFESLSRWEDKRPALRIGREWISDLIAERRSRDALGVMTRCLEWDPTFRPSRAAEAIRLVNEARDLGQAAVADAILTDFEVSYPDDPAVSIARQLRDG